MKKANIMRVWWIPQVPMSAFHVPVDSLYEAKKILDVLAKYDIFQLNNNIKPDFANAGGLSVLEDGDWCDWYDDDGNSIDDLSFEQCMLRDTTLGNLKPHSEAV